jgi:hypothetical protein
MKVFALILFAVTLLPACASKFSESCERWELSNSYPVLQWGTVELHKIYTCLSYSRVP